MTASLPAITALARAGAIGRAWALFIEGGYAERDDEPAALAVKGRLLKSRARLAPRADRASGFEAAAQAYAAANRLAPAPYLAINTATAHLLAGNPDRSADEARAVLAQLDAPDPLADTPYYLAVTRAEALLLIGDPAGAQAAMADAAAADPDGWADRAVTLAQLEEVGAALGHRLDWLDAYRPPASLHFAGHIGIAAGGASEARLAEQAADLIARERVGFGYGALAAGADIVIAERVVAAGGELHVVLPTTPERFEQQSVAPAGGDWTARYRRLLDRAASVKTADDWKGGAHDQIATRLAAELAIGASLLKAQSLDAHAVQLIVLDEAGGGANTAGQARLWREDERNRQHILTLSRDAEVALMFRPEAIDAGRRVATLLTIRVDRAASDALVESSDALIARASPVWQALEGIERDCIRAGPGEWHVILSDMDRAAGVIRKLIEAADQLSGTALSLGAHRAIVTAIQDVPSHALVPHGPAIAIPGRLLEASPRGVCTASEDFAVALTTFGIAGIRAELYHEGEPALGGAVYTLLAQ